MSELPDEVRSWIGKTLVEDEAEIDVERGTIANSCSSVQNGNPLFWNDEAAEAITRGPVAPPSMLSVWLRPHYWAPGRTRERLPLEVHFWLKDKLELPEAIVTGNEMVFGEPARLGDRLRARQTLRSISDEKTNRLGTGRYWVIDVEYVNQRGERVGTDSYTCFGYRRG